MKSKGTLVVIAVAVIAFWATFEYGHAASAPAPTGKIGVVSLRTLLSKTRHQTAYQGEMMTKQAQWNTELTSLSKAIEAAQAELATMRQGTADYLNQYNILLQKRSDLENRQEVLTQQRSMMEKEYIEGVYRAALGIVDELAAERGLDMVLERTTPEFPMASGVLTETLLSNKVLYAGNCPDLTNEVLRRLDAMDSLNP